MRRRIVSVIGKKFGTQHFGDIGGPEDFPMHEWEEESGEPISLHDGYTGGDYGRWVGGQYYANE